MDLENARKADKSILFQIVLDRRLSTMCKLLSKVTIDKPMLSIFLNCLPKLGHAYYDFSNFHSF
jgi:hypothetical protein